MKKNVVLSPDRWNVGWLSKEKYEIAEMAAETSLFSCSIEHARVKGGPITNEILDKIENFASDDMRTAYAEGLHEVIDVRVQRLMPGMFPSIPGWHCDSVPRPNYFAQPDFSLLNPASFHITCIADTEGGQGIGNTVFLNEELLFEYNDLEPVWQQLHKKIEVAPRRTFTVPSGRILKFSSKDAHKAVACTKRGWRMFFRMSMYKNPPLANAVTSQQQVYILSEENGW